MAELLPPARSKRGVTDAGKVVRLNENTTFRDYLKDYPSLNAVAHCRDSNWKGTVSFEGRDVPCSAVKESGAIEELERVERIWKDSFGSSE